MNLRVIDGKEPTFEIESDTNALGTRAAPVAIEFQLRWFRSNNFLKKTMKWDERNSLDDGIQSSMIRFN